MSKDPITRGTRVLTTQDAGRKDWVAGARDKCRWNQEGVVLQHKTGHGLCYEVLHGDGAEAWYDHDEVELANLPDSCDGCRATDVCLSDNSAGTFCDECLENRADPFCK